MRTLILLSICTVFVGIALVESRGKPRPEMVRDACVGLFFALITCWVLIHWVGIFDGWKYSLRR